MNNAALQALFEECEERVCVITFDNAYRCFIGYQNSHVKSVHDIELKTINGVDFVCIPTVSNYSKDRKDGVSAKVYHLTECVQSVTIMDEGFENYRMDPAIHS